MRYNEQWRAWYFSTVRDDAAMSILIYQRALTNRPRRFMRNWRRYDGRPAELAAIQTNVYDRTISQHGLKILGGQRNGRAAK